jgi:hypothetical protein
VRRYRPLVVYSLLLYGSVVSCGAPISPYGFRGASLLESEGGIAAIESRRGSPMCVTSAVAREGCCHRPARAHTHEDVAHEGVAADVP